VRNYIKVSHTFIAAFLSRSSIYISNNKVNDRCILSNRSSVWQQTGKSQESQQIYLHLYYFQEKVKPKKSSSTQFHNYGAEILWT